MPRFVFCVFCHARFGPLHLAPSTHRSESKANHLRNCRSCAGGIFYCKKLMFLKIGVPPNRQFLRGFSIIFTIHFGVSLFLETPKYLEFLGNFELYG